MWHSTLTNVNVDQIILNNASDDFCPDKFSDHLVRQTVIWLEIVQCPTIISGPAKICFCFFYFNLTRNGVE